MKERESQDRLSYYLIYPDASCPARVLALPLGQTLSIGRNPDRDLVLQNRCVSRHHCIFGRDDAGLWVEDAGSRHGTYRGQLQLPHQQRHRLSSGDVVRIYEDHVRVLAIDPAWLLWNEGTVCRLAEGIRREGAFERLPILADALEEAGCAGEALLAHCRSSPEHSPSCWALQVLQPADTIPPACLPPDRCSPGLVIR